MPSGLHNAVLCGQCWRTAEAILMFQFARLWNTDQGIPTHFGTSNYPKKLSHASVKTPAASVAGCERVLHYPMQPTQGLRRVRPARTAQLESSCADVS